MPCGAITGDPRETLEAENWRKVTWWRTLCRMNAPTTHQLGVPTWDQWDAFWNRWKPRECATLLFVIANGQVLLIEKRRGLGAGKVNAPGGRVQPGEHPRQAAIRETREEVGVEPLNPEWTARLRFQFLDGYSIQGDVFVSRQALGEPHETPEARPFWVRLDELPYDRMWEDDRFWLPHVLAGRTVDAYFFFDGDSMLRYRIVVGAEPPPEVAPEAGAGPLDERRAASSAATRR